MHVNLSQGLFRVWVGLSVVWALAVGALAYVSMISSTSPNWTTPAAAKVMSNGLDISSLRPVGDAPSLPARLDWLGTHLATFAILILVPVAVVFALGALFLWAARGFQPTPVVGRQRAKLASFASGLAWWFVGGMSGMALYYQYTLKESWQQIVSDPNQIVTCILLGVIAVVAGGIFLSTPKQKLPPTTRD
jgi:hypothetical protein